MMEEEMSEAIVVATICRQRLVLELLEVDKLRLVDEQEVKRLRV